MKCAMSQDATADEYMYEAISTYRPVILFGDYSSMFGGSSLKYFERYSRQSLLCYLDYGLMRHIIRWHWRWGHTAIRRIHRL